MTGPCGFGAVSAAARFGRTEPEDFFVKSLPIPCSAECARHQRNAKLAGALKIDIEKAAGPPIEFTDGLLDAARTRPDFIRSVETSIEQFVCDKMLRVRHKIYSPIKSNLQPCSRRTSPYTSTYPWSLCLSSTADTLLHKILCVCCCLGMAIAPPSYEVFRSQTRT
eukprot:m.283946 g.283946  ORF g.283946 m.283946 type:complete len:166 (-) comp15759_c0_seq12:417-914(-)